MVGDQSGLKNRSGTVSTGAPGKATSAIGGGRWLPASAKAISHHQTEIKFDEFACKPGSNLVLAACMLCGPTHSSCVPLRTASASVCRPCNHACCCKASTTHSASPCETFRIMAAGIHQLRSNLKWAEDSLAAHSPLQNCQLTHAKPQPVRKVCHAPPREHPLAGFESWAM